MRDIISRRVSAARACRILTVCWMQTLHYYVVDLDDELSSEGVAQEEDFAVQLPASYDFKLNSVHFAKMQEIRTMKNNKKRMRLFEAMGIPIEVDKSARSKKIIMPKQTPRSTSASRAREGIPFESISAIIDLSMLEKETNSISVANRFVMRGPLLTASFFRRRSSRQRIPALLLVDTFPMNKLAFSSDGTAVRRFALAHQSLN